MKPCTEHEYCDQDSLTHAIRQWEKSREELKAVLYQSLLIDTLRMDTILAWLTDRLLRFQRPK